MKRFSILFTLSFILFPKLHSQTWTSHSTGSSGYIYSISFPNMDTGYVSDSQGIIWKTVNGAANWNSVTTSFNAYYVCFVNGTKGFALSDTVVYGTTDGGITWNATISDSRMNFTMTKFADTNTGFLTGINAYTSGDSVRLYKTSNGGSTWTLLRNDFSFFPESALGILSNTNFFYAQNSMIDHSLDGGTTFSNVYTDTFNSDLIFNLDFPNSDTGYAIQFNSMLKSTDEGATWTPITGPGVIMYDSYFMNGKTGFVCGGNGFSSGWVSLTTDAGTSWVSAYSSPYTFYCMDFPSDTIGFVGGDNGTVLKYSTIGPNTIVEPDNNAPGFSVYPNPASATITLTNLNEKCLVRLYSGDGSIVKELKTENPVQEIDLELPDGVYIIEVSSANIINRKKLVVFH